MFINVAYYGYWSQVRLATVVGTLLKSGLDTYVQLWWWGRHYVRHQSTESGGGEDQRRSPITCNRACHMLGFGVCLAIIFGVLLFLLVWVLFVTMCLFCRYMYMCMALYHVIVSTVCGVCQCLSMCLWIKYLVIFFIIESYPPWWVRRTG